MKSYNKKWRSDIRTSPEWTTWSSPRILYFPQTPASFRRTSQISYQFHAPIMFVSGRLSASCAGLERFYLTFISFSGGFMQISFICSWFMQVSRLALAFIYLLIGAQLPLLKFIPPSQSDIPCMLLSRWLKPHELREETSKSCGMAIRRWSYGILLSTSYNLYVFCVVLSRIWFLIWDAWWIFTFLFMAHPCPSNHQHSAWDMLWVFKLLQRRAHLMQDKRLGTVAGSPRYIEPPESSKFDALFSRSQNAELLKHVFYMCISSLHLKASRVSSRAKRTCSMARCTESILINIFFLGLLISLNSFNAIPSLCVCVRLVCLCCRNPTCGVYF